MRHDCVCDRTAAMLSPVERIESPTFGLRSPDRAAMHASNKLYFTGATSWGERHELLMPPPSGRVWASISANLRLIEPTEVCFSIAPKSGGGSKSLPRTLR